MSNPDQQYKLNLGDLEKKNKFGPDKPTMKEKTEHEPETQDDHGKSFDGELKVLPDVEQLKPDEADMVDEIIKKDKIDFAERQKKLEEEGRKTYDYEIGSMLIEKILQNIVVARQIVMPNHGSDELKKIVTQTINTFKDEKFSKFARVSLLGEIDEFKEIGKERPIIIPQRENFSNPVDKRDGKEKAANDDKS